MTYGIDPVVADTVRHYDQKASYQERVEAAECAVISDFIEACQKVDANAMCLWAGMTTDWENAKAPVIAGQPLPQRVKLLHEVMADSLEYAQGPDISEVMQLVLNVAYGSDCQANLAEMARDLARRMAMVHARHSVVVV